MRSDKVNRENNTYEVEDLPHIVQYFWLSGADKGENLVFPVVDLAGRLVREKHGIEPFFKLLGKDTRFAFPFFLVGP